MTWHRIDDPDNPAPKEWWVLGWAPGWIPVTMCWEDMRGIGRPDHGWFVEWRIANGVPFKQYIEPTHWHPLPNPPEKERT